MRRPIFWAAVFLTAGLVVPIPDIPPWCWGACALAALAGALALAIHASSARSAGLACAAMLAGFFAAGRLAALGVVRQHPGGIGELLMQHPGLFEGGVTFTGRLARSHRWEPRPETEAGDVELLIDVETVEAGQRRLAAHGRVRLRLPPPEFPPGQRPAGWRRGVAIKGFGRILMPASLGNPGAFDSRRHLLARGIHATGTVKSWRLIELTAPAGGGICAGILDGVDRLRHRLLVNLADSFERDSRGRRASAIAGALLLGERSGLPPDDALALQKAGLSHLLAVSGFNVAVLAGLLLLGLRVAGAPPRLIWLVMIPALGVYLLLNQDESSVARAVVMAVAWFAGRAMWRKPDLLSTLGLAALLILVAQPLQVYEPGFQLTFTATLSLILMQPLLPARSSRHCRRGARRRLARRAARFMLEAAAATMAALIGTLPLAIVHFNRVTPGALPANLLAGPLMAAAFVLTLAIEFAAPFSSLAARAAAWCATMLIEMTFTVAEAVNGWPIAGMMSWRRPDAGLCLQGLFAGSVACLAALAASGRLRGRWGALAAMVCVVSGIVLAAPIDTRSAPQGLRITMLDVGQGDATLIETPMRARILVDAGGAPRGSFDVGERVVSQALWSMGITSLDVVAVTHDDADHLGGAAAVVANFHPREVWLPQGAQLWPSGRNIARLKAAALEAGARLRLLARGSRPRLPGVAVLVMNPPQRAAGGGPGALADNEGSLVLLIEYAGRHALLTGDAGAATERALENLPAPMDLLKVGHHGSRSSTSSSLLAAARPRVALISCGRGNRFGHPSREVLERLGKAGVRVCRTDLDGALGVELLGAPGRETLLSQSCAFPRRPRVIPLKSAGDSE